MYLVNKALSPSVSLTLNARRIGIGTGIGIGIGSGSLRMCCAAVYPKRTTILARRKRQQYSPNNKRAYSQKRVHKFTIYFSCHICRRVRLGNYVFIITPLRETANKLSTSMAIPHTSVIARSSGDEAISIS